MANLILPSVCFFDPPDLVTFKKYISFKYFSWLFLGENSNVPPIMSQKKELQELWELGTIIIYILLIKTVYFLGLQHYKAMWKQTKTILLFSSTDILEAYNFSYFCNKLMCDLLCQNYETERCWMKCTGGWMQGRVDTITCYIQARQQQHLLPIQISAALKAYYSVT